MELRPRAGRDRDRRSRLCPIEKYHDAERSGRAAIVIDDLASVDPWRPRGIEIRGGAEVVDDPPRIRIRPQRIVSWGLDNADFFSRDARTVG